MNETPLVLAKKRGKNSSGSARQIMGLLRTVGVPRRLLYVRGDQRNGHNGSFWSRPINHLEVLELARKQYREEITLVHPDKPNGCPERAIALNHAWNGIERRFRQHGHELW